jgi:hypothetical protein
MDVTINTTTIEVNSPPPTQIEIITNPVQIKGDSFASVEFDFNSPSDMWIVNHNKGYYPSVIVLNIFGKVVLAEIEHISTNQVRLYFSSNQTGKVIIN